MSVESQPRTGGSLSTSEPTGADEAEIGLEVNGIAQRSTVPVRRLLVDYLRYDLGLTGTHIGCEQGVCGACTVVVDGQAVRSCIMLAVQADGRQITTIEGLCAETEVERLQTKLTEHHGLQCGYCTPGIVATMSTMGGDLGREQIRDVLAGHLCRCTGYQHIVDAVDAWQRATPDRTDHSNQTER